ncbi:MAG TPA: MBL fold metallo-hydrolase [Nevskia sp.]|nr:MBL fold metallo-hydrolase [Nevskia sp.]
MKYLLMLCLLSAAAVADAPPAAPDAAVSFSLVKTGHTHAPAAMIYSGGSFTQTLEVNHVAVLVRHGADLFLFDSGLGRRIAQQYAEDMPWWAKPSFKYEPPVTPARDQLDAAGLRVPRIILSHSHWDHASGLVDFPEAEVWVTPEERAFDQGRGLGFPGAFPSQIGSPDIRWHVYRLQDRPQWSFARSLDLYGDGSAVLVPLEGHTPGAVGLLLTLGPGRQYLFCGDTVWSAAALQQARPKFFLASLIADDDRAGTQRAILQLRELTRQHPGLVVVPAHDAALQDPLGYFPQWVR